MAAPKKPAAKPAAKAAASPPAAPKSPAPKARPEVPRSTEPAPALSDYALTHFPEPSTVAEQLARYLGEHNLVVYGTAEAEGPAYIGLAGWQFVGAQLGQAAVLEWVNDTTVAPDATYNYHARANLVHLATGRQLGAGEALASSNEPALSRASANIVAGIAQNRALVNAYYHSLAWLMRLAGVEAAPPELVAFLPAPPEAAPMAVPAVVPSPRAEPAPARAEKPAPTTLRQADQAAADVANASANAAPKGPLMTQKQREEIIRLCNHPLIERPEKTRVNMRINTYDEDKAAQVIRELRSRIDKRENLK